MLNTIVPSTNPTMLAPAGVRIFQKRSGMSAWALRASMNRNAAIRTAEANSTPMVSAEPQPFELACVSPYTSSSRLAVTVVAPGRVEVAAHALDAALAYEPRHEDERDDADRDVDPEHPLPAGVLGEDAAQQHADGGAGARDRAQDPQRLVALGALLERDHRDREDRRREHGRGAALEQAEDDQHRVRLGQRAAPEKIAKSSEPHHEEPPPPEHVAGAPAEQQEAAEGEAVAAHHPLEVLGREAQVGLDGRQGDVHDRDVEHHHQVGDAEHRECEPAPGVGAWMTCPWRTPFSFDCAPARYRREAGRMPRTGDDVAKP